MLCTKIQFDEMVKPNRILHFTIETRSEGLLVCKAVYGEVGHNIEREVPWFQTFAAVLMTSAPFWDSWPVKVWPIRCPESSVNNYHTTTRNIPEGWDVSCLTVKFRKWNGERVAMISLTTATFTCTYTYSRLIKWRRLRNTVRVPSFQHTSPKTLSHYLF